MRKFQMLAFISIIIILMLSTSGCLGSHQTCPKCDGNGRDPDYLYFFECERCGGDGEIGLFMDAEDVEDIISVIIAIVLIILVIIFVLMEMSKSSKHQPQYTPPPPPPPPPSPQTSHQYPPPPPKRMEGTSEKAHWKDDERPKPKRFCPGCGAPSGGKQFCAECGEKLV